MKSKLRRTSKMPRMWSIMVVIAVAGVIIGLIIALIASMYKKHPHGTHKNGAIIIGTGMCNGVGQCNE